MRIRVPADLEVQIRIAAGQNGRSMNAEITHRLERSFETGGSSYAVDAATARLERALVGFADFMESVSMQDVFDFVKARDAEKAGRKKRKPGAPRSLE